MERFIDKIVTVIFILAVLVIGYFAFKFVSNALAGGGNSGDVEIEATDEDDLFADDGVDDTYDTEDDDHYNEDVPATEEIPEEYNDGIASIMEDDENEPEAATTADDNNETAGSGSASSTSSDDDDVFTEKSGSTTTSAPAQKPAKSVDNSAKYLVVVGSYSSETNANSQLAPLGKVGYNNAEVVKFDHSKFYTVVAARYNSEASAREAVKQLKSKNQIYKDCYVHTRR